MFALKKEALIKDINNNMFGLAASHIHVVEFQKRGLPHVHLLIILDKTAKIDSAEKVDEYVINLSEDAV